MLAVIGNIEYLRQGGRLSASAVLVASLLRIKPIVDATGRVNVVSKQMGMIKSVRYIIDTMSQEIDTNYPVVFGHTVCKDELNDFIEKCKSVIPELKIAMITDIGPTVGVHAGPGSFGIAYVRK